MIGSPGAVVSVVLSENFNTFTLVLLVTEILTRLAPTSNDTVPFEENNLPSVKLIANSPASRYAVFAMLEVLGVRPVTAVRLI